MSIRFTGIDRRTALGRAVRWPLSLIPRKQDFPFCWAALRGRRWIVGSSNHGCWLGSYERAQQRVLLQNLGAGNVFFDAGAHVGFYTLLAAALVGRQGQVIAFEPAPANVGYDLTPIDGSCVDRCTEILARHPGRRPRQRTD